ncbi:hypothetical protein TB1_039133 [Malus domestica]
MVSGSGIRTKRVVVDRHHARSSGTVVTKDLLNDQPTAVVRAEQTAISRGLVTQKRMNTQPRPHLLPLSSQNLMARVRG